MDAAVVPRGVGALQLAGRSETRNAERGERGAKRLGVRAGQGGSLNGSGPGLEQVGDSGQLVERLDGDRPPPRGRGEPRIGLDQHRSLPKRRAEPADPTKIGRQAQLLDGGEGPRVGRPRRPERRQTTQLGGDRPRELDRAIEGKARVNRADRKAAALVEQGDVARYPRGEGGQVAGVDRPHDPEARFWAVAEELVRYARGEIVQGSLVAVGQHAGGLREERILDPAIAAGPGRGGIGGECRLATDERCDERRGERGLGGGRFEQRGAPQGDRGGERLNGEPRKIAGEDREDEAGSLRWTLPGGGDERAEGLFADAAQYRTERGLETRAGKSARRKEERIERLALDAPRIQKGLDRFAPGGDEPIVGQGGEGRAGRFEPLCELLGEPGGGRVEAHRPMVTRSKLEAMATPEVSVVVPTYNRMDVLPEVLAALEGQQGAPPFEILVVDDGSTDATPDFLLSREASGGSIPFRQLRQENQGPAAARNAGVEAAAAPWVAFLGDDTVPAPGWLAAHRAAHRRRGDDPLHAVIGYTGWHPRMRLNPFLRYINEQGLQFGYALIDDPEDVPFNFFYTSNLSLSRELLRAEPFDLRFPYPAWEDIEVAYRMKKKGLRLTYERRATVAHDHPTDLGRFSLRQEKAGYCGVVFYRLHPELGPFVGVGAGGPPPLPPAARQRRLERLVRALQNWPVSLPKAWEEVLRFHYIKGLHRAWVDGDGTARGEVR